MKLIREMKELLDGTGLPWSIERGSKHLLIILNGRRVGVLPSCGRSNTRRADLNTRAAIKRAIKQIEPENTP